MRLIFFGAIFIFLGCFDQEETKTETSNSDQCTQNEDCWCRIFNGAKFLEGMNQSSCCLILPENPTKSDSLECPRQNHCMNCLHE